MQRRTIIGGPCPSWQVPKGYLMQLDPKEPILTIKGSAARLTIQQDFDDDHWRVAWWIGHGCGEVSGHLMFSREDVRRAFGLEDGFSKSGRLMFGKVNTHLDAAEQGAYVRYGQYLNIPHPGTGMQGDPNISLELTDEIVKAVEALLAP